MKKIFFLAAALTATLQANALIVSVNGHGEIPAEGMGLTINKAEIDPLTGAQVMELSGNLLADSHELKVTMVRSAEGVTDEFCCGSECTAGNGQLNEVKEFGINGLTSWYVHYSPQPASDVTVRYVFDDGIENRTLTVRYVYAAEGIEHTEAGNTNAAVYAPNGTMLQADGDLQALPAGMYIQSNKKIILTK